MRYQIAGLGLILIGCGHLSDIDGRLGKITSEFLADCHKYNNELCLIRFEKGISVGVAEQNSLDTETKRVLGVCERPTSELERRKVLIDEVAFTRDKMVFKTIVYHELFHCLVDRGHSTTGIMAPKLIYISPENWKDMVRDEFEKAD